MQVRYPGVVLVSLVMALHTIMIGRYLESVFFIIAFCWGWMAVTAYRDRLKSAQSMALIMLGILVLIVLPMAVLRLDGSELFSYLSLAIVPGIISWSCMFVYIRHISKQNANGGEPVS